MLKVESCYYVYLFQDALQLFQYKFLISQKILTQKLITRALLKFEHLFALND